MSNILVPELDVSDLDVSLRFYVGVVGFAVLFTRPDERFAYLTREGAELMLEEASGPGRRFRTAPLEKPFGRGVNFQIKVSSIAPLYDAVRAAGHEPLIALEERWYAQSDGSAGNRQFVVADPDGYLLRFFEDLGRR